jgi:hypothetical protein
MKEKQVKMGRPFRLLAHQKTSVLLLACCLTTCMAVPLPMMMDNSYAPLCECSTANMNGESFGEKTQQQIPIL